MNGVIPCVKLVIEEEGKLIQEPVFLQWNSDGLRGGRQCGRGKILVTMNVSVPAVICAVILYYPNSMTMLKTDSKKAGF